MYRGWTELNGNGEGLGSRSPLAEDILVVEPNILGVCDENKE